MHELPKTTDVFNDMSDIELSTVRILTGSRLHFGLLSTAAPFGGVGLMIQAPATEILVRPSDTFRCADDERDRVESIASRVTQISGQTNLPPCAIEIVQRPPAHCGLGSGTQLSLALAEALVRWCGVSLEQAAIVNEIAGRGKRSAVGSHGYFQGGLVYEEASTETALNPIVARVEIPEAWRVAILRPTHPSTLVCGEIEAEQFGRLPSVSWRQRNELRSIITGDMLPAAREQNFAGFADAVQRYNHASGNLFAAVQDGPYNGSKITELVQWLTNQRARGIGQSSWGPGVFAWFECEEDWQAFRPRIPTAIELIAITSVRNQPRECLIA